MKRILFIILNSQFLILNSFSQTWSGVAGGVNMTGGGWIEQMDVFQNKLYVCGGFQTAGNINSATIASWNGFKWDSVGSSSSPDGVIRLTHSDTMLYAAGGFFDADGVPNTYRLARWNGTQWLSVSADYPNTPQPHVIKYKDNFYVGGNYTQVGTLNVNRIARFNGTGWDNVAGGVTGGFIPQVTCMAVYNNDLYVGGDFTVAGGKPANYIARWDGTTWDAVGSGFDDLAGRMFVDTINNFLYVSGGFTIAGGVPVTQGFAKWDGIAWSNVGLPSMPNTVSLPSSFALYRGKFFLGFGSGTASVTDTIFGYWDGSAFKRIEGPNDGITALQVYNDTLFVGGYFNQVKDSVQGLLTVNYIAKYYEPQDTTCRFLQSLMYAYPPGNPKQYADTFKYNTDSVAVEFYNNIASASTWQWNFGDGKNGTGKTPLHYYTAGTYTVSVVVNYPYGPKGPCIDTVYKTITVINTTGIKEFKVSGLKFKVYPNPTTGEITIATDPPAGQAGEKGTFTVSITNAQGKEVIRKNFEKEIKLTLPHGSAVTKGIYTVKVCSEKGKVCHSEKVILQ